MAELGSHQLDACSIFLGKKHPLAVTGVGGTYFYTDGREVDDHVFTIFEFPGKAEKDRVIVTYSSINTNSFDGYGEMVMGSKGTMIVSQEKEILLYKEAGNPLDLADDQRDGGDRGQEAGAGDQPEHRRARPRPRRSAAWPPPIPRAATARSSSTSPTASATATPRTTTATSEHQPRCRGEVAMADAIIALTSNIAMRQNRRIEFDPKWFDYQSNEVPDSPAALARRV